MNRRQFFASSGKAATAAALTGLTAGAAPVPPATRPAPPLALAPFPALLNVTPDQATITCAITAPATGWVEYGTDERLGERADSPADGLLPYEDRALLFHLTGLKPATTYHYRVHARAINYPGAYSIKPGKSVQSETFSFRTPDLASPTATFTVWNDTHEIAETVAALSDSLHKSPTDFLLWNGDVANHMDDDAKIVEQYVHAGGTATRGTVPLFFNRGNHDVRGSAARHLSRYAPGLNNSFHYAFRRGPVAFLVLDTGEDKPDDTPAYGGLVNFSHYRDQQRQWLASAIEHPDFRSAPYRVAFAHIPLVWDADVEERWTRMYGPGVHGWVCDDGFAKWNDLLTRAGVSLVISGHIHRHFFFPPNARHPYAQLIGGGPQPDRATIITGHATPERLEIVTRDLTGQELHRHRIPPTA